MLLNGSIVIAVAKDLQAFTPSLASVVWSTEDKSH